VVFEHLGGAAQLLQASKLSKLGGFEHRVSQLALESRKAFCEFRIAGYELAESFSELGGKSSAWRWFFSSWASFLTGSFGLRTGAFFGFRFGFCKGFFAT